MLQVVVVDNKLSEILEELLFDDAEVLVAAPSCIVFVDELDLLLARLLP